MSHPKGSPSGGSYAPGNISACHLWNGLPDSVVTLPSAQSFKAVWASKGHNIIYSNANYVCMHAQPCTYVYTYIVLMTVVSSKVWFCVYIVHHIYDPQQRKDRWLENQLAREV